jgi:hypothetical protein
MVDISFKFHPVGQGLFYSGIIKENSVGNSFSFVYDCGSKSSRTYINNEIANYSSSLKSSSGKLDLLFISHFHDDHVNKIGDLLQATGGCRFVVLPYLNENERYLLTLYHIFDGSSPETIDFVINPTEFLSKFEIEEIIFVHPSTENLDYESEIPENVPDSDSKEFELNKHLVVNEDIKESNSNVQHCFDSGYIIVNQFWEFKLYCKKVDLAIVESLIREIKIQCKLDDINISTLAQFITDNKDSFITSFKEFFEEIKKRKYFNDIGLVVYHGHIMGVGDESRVGCFPYWKNQKENGTLLTGDLDFDDNVINEIVAKWRSEKYWDNVLVFQIPHHGAEDCLTENLFVKYKKVQGWVISFGLGNGHSHPNSGIVDLIHRFKFKGTLCLSYQGCGVKYRYKKVVLKLNETDEKSIMEIKSIKETTSIQEAIRIDRK